MHVEIGPLILKKMIGQSVSHSVNQPVGQRVVVQLFTTIPGSERSHLFAPALLFTEGGREGGREVRRERRYTVLAGWLAD